MLDSIDPLHKVKTIFHNEVKRYEKSNDSETAMSIAQLYEAMITGEEHSVTIIDIEMNNNEKLLPKTLLSSLP